MNRTTAELPELDMSAFRADPRSAAAQRFVAQLRDTCHGPGFCCLVATFGDNYLKIRLRSHRDVALAHYSDLGPP